VKFLVRGEVTDNNNNPLSNLVVQAMDSDQGFFEDRIDDFLESSVTNANGSFEIAFEDSKFKDKWLENEPETYLIVRNEKGQILHRTEKIDINKSIKISLDSVEKKTELPNVDPYANNIDRVLSAFGSLADITTFRTIDFERNLRLLISSVNAWVVYTNKIGWDLVGYDGPQVPRYPSNSHHSHTLSWEGKQ
jgi:hypothetical protein